MSRCPACLVGEMREVTYATAWICDRCELGARQLTPEPEPVVPPTPPALSDVTTEELVQRLVDEAGIDRDDPRRPLDRLTINALLALVQLRHRAQHHADEPLKVRARVIAGRLHLESEKVRSLARRWGSSGPPLHSSNDSNGVTSDGGE